MSTQPDASDAVSFVTRSGVKMRVRRAVPSDRADVSAFFNRVSADDRRHRFLRSDAPVETEVVEKLVSCDPEITTFLAITPDERIIASATLTGSAQGKVVDVAISVDEAFKSQGVSWSMMEHMLCYATAQGYEKMTSVQSGDDWDAVRLEREMGFAVRLVSASPVVLALSKTLE